MTAKEILTTIAALPDEEFYELQEGMADLIAKRFSSEEVAEIKVALAEAEENFKRGESFSSEEVRRHLGLL